MGFVSWVEAWPVIQGRVREMLARGRGDGLSEQMLLEGLQSGRFRMVGARIDGKIVGCCIIELRERPQGRALFVLGMFGSGLDRWFGPGLAFLDVLAERAGCYCIETQARAGSAAKLRDSGWRNKAILMEKRHGRII